MKTVFLKLSALLACVICISSLQAQSLIQKRLSVIPTDHAVAIDKTPAGGFIIGGAVTSFGNGASDMFLSRFDSSGTQVWSRAIGTAANDSGYAVASTLDNGFALVGITWGAGIGNADLFISKLDGSGQLLWSKAFGTPQRDVATHVFATADSGFAVAGYVVFPQSLTPVMTDAMNVFLKKFDKNGNELWTQYYATLSCHYQLDCMVQQPNGDFVFWIRRTCQATPPYYSNDNMIMRTDALGQIRWQKTHSGSIPGVMEASSDNGTLFLHGYTGSSLEFFKLDSAGTGVLGKTYGYFAPVTPGSIIDMPGNGYLITGNVQPTQLTTAGTLFLRIADNGTPISGHYQRMSNYPTIAFMRSELLTDGRLAHTSGVAGGCSVVVSDSLGQPFCSDDSTLTIYMNAYSLPFSNENPVNTPPVVTNATPNVGNVSFLFQESNLCSPIIIQSVPEDINTIFSIAPNPSDGFFTFKTSASGTKAISVVNLLGETVFASSTAAQQLELDLRGEARGVYFVNMTNEKGERTTAKMVVR